MSVLYTSDALPGKAEQWSELIYPRGRIRSPDEAPRVLAAIPFREVPDRGRLEKRLAYEAWQLACREFSEAELPSVATIQRSMVEILGGGSG